MNYSHNKMPLPPTELYQRVVGSLVTTYHLTYSFLHMKYFIPIPFLFIVIIFFQSIDLPLHNLPGDDFDRRDY